MSLEVDWDTYDLCRLKESPFSYDDVRVVDVDENNQGFALATYEERKGIEVVRSGRATIMRGRVAE